MKWSRVAALLAAPLVLAGSPLGDLNRRIAHQMKEGQGVSANDMSGSTTVVVKEEIVLIWACNGGGEATKTVTQMETMTSSPMATHTVIVGGPAGLVYTPESLNANVGDMVVFTFMQQNHTLTQSTFAAPCDAMPGGMDTSFVPNPNNTVNPPPQMAMQVKVSTPLWFFCGQKGHCGKGMTFSINPTAAKSQAMFKQMAIAQNGTANAQAAVAPGTTTTLAAAQASTASATGSAAVASGSGSPNAAGECACSCLCGVSNFPSKDQGLMNFGGMPGSMPKAP